MKSSPLRTTVFGRVALWAALGAGSLGFAALAVSQQTAAVLLLGGSILLGVAVAVPKALLLMSIPLVVLGDGLEVSSISLSVPLAAMMMAAWALGVLSGRWPVKPAIHALILLFGTLLSFSYFTTSVVLEPQISRAADLGSLLVGLSFLMVSVSIPPPRKQLLITISATAVVAGVITMSTASADPGRVFALTLNPNYLAILLSIGAVAAVGLVRMTKNPIWFGAAAICFVAMVPTGSRGAGIALVFGLLSILLLGRRRSIQIALVVILFGAAYFVPWQKAVQEEITSPTRTLNDLTNSDSVRTRAALLALDYALEQPIKGIGYGEFAIAASLDSRVGIYVNTHNDYLRVAAESGIPALVALLMILGIAFRGVKKGSSRPLRPLIVVYAVGLLFANLLSNIIVTLPIWLCLGVALSASPARVFSFARRPSAAMARPPLENPVPVSL